MKKVSVNGILDAVLELDKINKWSDVIEHPELCLKHIQILQCIKRLGPTPVEKDSIGLVDMNVNVDVDELMEVVEVVLVDLDRLIKRNALISCHHSSGGVKDDEESSPDGCDIFMDETFPMQGPKRSESSGDGAGAARDATKSFTEDIMTAVDALLMIICLKTVVVTGDRADHGNKELLLSTRILKMIQSLPSQFVRELGHLHFRLCQLTAILLNQTSRLQFKSADFFSHPFVSEVVVGMSKIAYSMDNISCKIAVSGMILFAQSCFLLDPDVRVSLFVALVFTIRLHISPC